MIHCNADQNVYRHQEYPFQIITSSILYQKLLLNRSWGGEGTFTTKTVVKRIAVSKLLKYNVIGWPIIHPNNTINGATSSAICYYQWYIRMVHTIDDPTATPTAKSILFLYATVTAVTCSAALPTMGKTINPINVVETPDDATIWSIELTRNSAQTATTAVLANNNRIAMSGVISATSSGSSDSVSEPGSSYKCECVLSWKKRYLCYFWHDGE